MSRRGLGLDLVVGCGSGEGFLLERIGRVGRA